MSEVTNMPMKMIIYQVTKMTMKILSVVITYQAGTESLSMEARTRSW